MLPYSQHYKTDLTVNIKNQFTEQLLFLVNRNAIGNA